MSINIDKQIGNYRLVSSIGRGTFGRVYRGEHIDHPSSLVAMKLFSTTFSFSQEEQESFQQEALFLQTIQHPNILPILDTGLHNGIPYIVSELATHGSLRDLIKEHAPAPFPEQEALAILEQTGRALEYAHRQNIIHLDLKPENILFNASGEALLADFGIVTILDSAINKRPLSPSPYMAPEQLDGQISKETDQYALGSIAYELFTGCKPLAAVDSVKSDTGTLSSTSLAPTQLNPELPAHIEQAILKAMAKKPEERYPDIAAFITALQPHTPANASESAPSISTPSTPRIDASIRPKQRRFPFPKRLTAAVVFLLLCLIGGSLAFSFYQAPPTSHLQPKRPQQTRAVVKVVPQSKTWSQQYRFTGTTATPNPAQDQLAAHVLSSTQGQVRTIPATGSVTQPAIAASGTLIILNHDVTLDLTLNAGTLIPNDFSPPIQLTLDKTVTIPSATGFTRRDYGSATVIAHVTEAGALGNIPAFDQNTATGFYHCFNCHNRDTPSGWEAENLTALTGGQDAQNYKFIQQSDLDGANKSLQEALTQAGQADIQRQVHANEALSGATQCQSSTKADHAVGDHVDSFTVTGSAVCSNESYDRATALQMASDMLKFKLDSTGFLPSGTISTQVTSAMSSDAQGTLQIVVQAETKSVFRFNALRKQKLVQALTGQSVQNAQKFLNQQEGVKQATIDFSGNEHQILPADPGHIEILVGS